MKGLSHSPSQRERTWEELRPDELRTAEQIALEVKRRFKQLVPPPTREVAAIEHIHDQVLLEAEAARQKYCKTMKWEVRASAA